MKEQILLCLYFVSFEFGETNSWEHIINKTKYSLLFEDRFDKFDYLSTKNTQQMIFF
jgi:hypothetical protein